MISRGGSLANGRQRRLQKYSSYPSFYVPPRLAALAAIHDSTRAHAYFRVLRAESPPHASVQPTGVHLEDGRTHQHE